MYSISKNPDPLEEDTDCTVTFTLKNTDSIDDTSYIFVIVIFDLKDPEDYASNDDFERWLLSQVDRENGYSGFIDPISAGGTKSISVDISGSKSRRYIYFYSREQTVSATAVTTTYTLEIDRYKDQDGATINRDQKKGNMFIGTYNSLGTRNDILYIKGDEQYSNNRNNAYNFPFIINQENFKKIEPDYYYVHYDSSTYTYGGTIIPDPSSPSLELLDQSNIATDKGYSPIIGKSNIALSYYRNPNNTRTVSSTVEDLLDNIPQLKSTTNSIYSTTPSLGLLKGMNKPYNVLFSELAKLTNMEYWQSTTRDARTGSASLTPNFYFQPIKYTDTSVQTFNCDNTTSPDSTYYVIRSDLHRSVETADGFYNVVEIFGGTDDKGMPVYTKLRDKSSVSMYGTTILSLSDPNITSYDEVVDKARDLLLKGSRGRVKGTILVSGNWQSLHSKMITFNDTRNGWINEDLMVRATRYYLLDHYTELSVNNDYLNQNSVLDSFMYNIKNNEIFTIPSTNEEVKYISAFGTYSGSISGGKTYYMALLTGPNLTDELSGNGYERKAIVTSTINETYFDFVHMNAVWQQWDGKTDDTSPITHVALFNNITGGSFVLNGPYAIDGGKQYKWKSTQLYVSLVISTT